MNNCFCLLLVLLAQDSDAHKVGQYSVSFKDRHPLSDVKELAKRQGWKLDEVRKKEPDFETRKIEEESYQVVVPAAYAREKSFGLLVWVSPMPSGGLPDEWLEPLAKRDVIAIGADNSGNDRGTAYRVALALDAVHNVKARYTIDPKRIYVTGFSGGGRTACRLGIAYPDVFTGGIYQGGTDFYRGVPDPADAKREFPPGFVKPEDALFRKVKAESRHVIVAGEEDFNRPSCKATYEMMTKRENFARATYIEMPGAPHVWADAATFAKALDALDAPLKAKK
jgi:dienelactone hydrolase